MKQVVMVAVAVMLTMGVASAQFVQDWQTLSGTSSNSEAFNGVCAAYGGGVIAVGKQYNTSSGLFEAVYAYINPDGTVAWRNVFGTGTGLDFWLDDVCQVPNDETRYVAVGWAQNGSTRFPLAMDFYSNGTLHWQLDYFGTAGGGELHHVEPDGDGFIASGVTDGSTYADGLVIRMQNNILYDWHTTHGTYNFNRLYHISPTSDGGYIATGFGYTQVTGRYPWTLKLNANGAQQWSSYRTGYWFGVGRSVLEADNGDFLFCGYYDNGPGDQFMVLRTNSSGSLLWDADYGADNGDENADWIAEAPGGGYYLTGDGDSNFTNDRDLWLVHIDENGSMIDNQIFNSPNYQWANAACFLNSSDIIVVGEDNIYWNNSAAPWATRLSFQADFVATIEPAAPPVVIPANGGSFNYIVGAINNTNNPIQADAWVQVHHVPSDMSVEVRLFENVGFPANNTVTANLNQTIPANAPGGQYRISLYIGDHPWSYDTFASFDFSKTAAGAEDFTVFEQPELWTVSGSFEGAEQAVASAETLPSEFSLSAAYPNPFNPSTTLNVNLPEAANLSVTVYNVTGQQVAELARGSHTAGSHTLTFDASGLTSGVYFVHASANGWSAMQKVMLVR
ncbi:T9SS type A sorting domain-containing protein [bacterium]|nr:T9SS type A sorting domain-containing protein [bacterium]